MTVCTLVAPTYFTSMLLSLGMYTFNVVLAVPAISSAYLKPFQETATIKLHSAICKNASFKLCNINLQYYFGKTKRFMSNDWSYFKNIGNALLYIKLTCIVNYHRCITVVFRRKYNEYKTKSVPPKYIQLLLHSCKLQLTFYIKDQDHHTNLRQQLITQYKHCSNIH